MQQRLVAARVSCPRVFRCHVLVTRHTSRLTARRVSRDPCELFVKCRSLPMMCMKYVINVRLRRQGLPGDELVQCRSVSGASVLVFISNQFCSALVSLSGRALPGQVLVDVSMDSTCCLCLSPKPQAHARASAVALDLPAQLRKADWTKPINFVSLVPCVLSLTGGAPFGFPLGTNEATSEASIVGIQGNFRLLEYPAPIFECRVHGKKKI